MTGWCYRVIKYLKGKDEKFEGELVYELCELFHEDGKVLGFGEIFLNYETPEELKESYKTMAEAFDHPVIEYKEDGKFYENGEELEKGDLIKKDEKLEKVDLTRLTGE